MSLRGGIKPVLDGFASLSLIAAAGVVLWAVSNPSQVQLNTSSAPAPAAAGASRIPAVPMPGTLSLVGTALAGDREASVAAVVFSDFQCPYCRSFAEQEWPTILRGPVGAGRLLFGYRHLPLEALHPDAFRAAVLADCSRRQAAFWDVHDLLFAKPDLSLSDLQGLRLASQLNFEALSDCTSGPGETAVRADIDLARRLGIRGTPTFVFGVQTDGTVMSQLRRVSGVLTSAQVNGIVNDILEAAEQTR